MTQEQIYEFLSELKAFAKDFRENGPGSVGENLELGVRKMDVRFENLSSIEVTLDRPRSLFTIKVH